MTSTNVAAVEKPHRVESLPGQLDLFDEAKCDFAGSKLSRYEEFVRSKVVLAEPHGFEPPADLPCPDWFKPHQRDICEWAIRLGRSAICCAFGLGKSLLQLQLAKWVHHETGGRFLICMPLGVRQEFKRDAAMIDMELEYVRHNDDIAKAQTPYLITNYERVRDGDFDMGLFAGASLDESSVLRSYGNLTCQQFNKKFKVVPYRWIATATPSPNDYLELINYSHFLGVMSRGECMTRFFGRDSKEAGALKLYPHMEGQFWAWVASWAVFLNLPSELGYDDTGYALPPLQTHWHCVDVDYSRAKDEIDKRSGQRQLLPKISGSVQVVAKERRHTMEDRINKALEIVRSEPDQHWIIWHYLEAERHLIKKLLPEAKSIYGTQDLDEREALTIGFAEGEFQYVSSKPEVSGSGVNWQRHCSRNVYVGPTDKFNNWIQSVHRTYRFLQDDTVHIHVVFAETQSPTVATMQRKWKQHDNQREIMSKLIKKNGLAGDAIHRNLARSIGCERQEERGRRFVAVNNDCVPELMNMPADSVDMICTSIPFSDHYEYSPSYNDMGHNHGDDGFFEQFDFLVPELYRVLRPGRIAAIHTKDRIEYGKMTGNGMYTVRPFSDKTVQSFIKHGWLYMGRIVIDTDVVRENAQTYRLGWTENSKDSTKMGVGSLEYVLIFRKFDPTMSPTDPPTSNGPDPVTKDKEEYLKSRWQIHACGIWRSSGNELMTPEKVHSMGVQGLYHWWKDYCERNKYDYPTHVEYCEMVDRAGFIPTAMMLFAPHSSNPDIWTDIQRINTLNTDLKRKENDSHVCLAEGSLVLTRDDGHKPIEEIEIGDMVLTHKGRWRPVLAKQCTGVNDVVKVTACGMPTIKLTPTHKMWSRIIGSDSDGEWTESYNLVGHEVRSHMAGAPSRDSWREVESIVSWGNITTWNLRVAEDASYTALGYVVKNCPLQLDLVERLLERYTNKGDTVLDPFGGVMTVPYTAIKTGRRGIGVELNWQYWKYGVNFCQRLEKDQNAPTLFDMLEEDPEPGT